MIIKMKKGKFWLTFTYVEQIRKEILKNSGSSPYFLKTDIRRKRFIKNNRLISLTETL
jgi:hypothetical protein